jgi:phytoene dehydrogenase-like protein
MTQSSDLREGPLSWKADRELEALREELEKEFRDEKLKLDGKKEQLHRKLDEMAENTLRQVEEEWRTYEEQVRSESVQFRESLERALREAVDSAFVERAAEEAALKLVNHILQPEKTERRIGEISS